MKLTYYGTAAGEAWPGVFCHCEFCEEARRLGGKNIRTRSQALVNEDLLIDMPADNYMHTLNYGLDLSKVKNLIVTHSHADHFYASDLELVREPYAHDRKFDLHVYGNENVLEKIKLLVPGGNGNLRYTSARAIPFETIAFEDYEVTPLLANHDKREECLFYLIRQNGKSILYAHDTGAFPDATMKYLIENKIQCDLISLDCTAGSEKDGEYHMGLEDAVAEKNCLIQFGVAKKSSIWVVNHFSHNGYWLYERMEQEAAKYGFVTSYDGLSLEI